MPRAQHTSAAASRVHPLTFGGLLALTLDQIARPDGESPRFDRSMRVQADYLHASMACLRQLHADIVTHGSPSIGAMEKAAQLIELADQPIPQALAAQEGA